VTHRNCIHFRKFYFLKSFSELCYGGASNYAYYLSDSARYTPILTGYQIFHNYIRPHESLEGKTPAEECGIKIKGQNKWLTIIQNASRK
jgi:hypothetical protein